MEIKITDIHPFVRYAQLLNVTEYSNFKGHRAYENRIFYVKSGKAIIRVAGKEYMLSEGDLVVFSPGILYDLDIIDKEYTLLGLNFDYLWDMHELDFPINPGKNNFDPSLIIEKVSFSDHAEFNSPIILRSYYSAGEALLDILEEYRQAKILSSEIISSKARDLLLSIFRQILVNTREKNVDIDDILKYINIHCSENITNSVLGAHFGYHPNYLNHLIVNQTGISLHKYILKCRIMKAIDLLQTTNLQANQIAFSSGFSDYNHFLKYFKKITGKNTKDFR